jgi:magnesium chelatase family protein
VNLAPADLHKVSSLFDLPITLGILTAQHVLSVASVAKLYFAGELGLDGAIRGTRHMFLFAEWADRLGKSLVLPSEAAPLLSPSARAQLYSENSLRALVSALRLGFLSPVHCGTPSPFAPPEPDLGLDGVVGHAHAKRGLEIAAAGGHHVCLWGPPGAGKTLLARGFESILPPLSSDAASEVRRIYSLRAQDRLSPLTTLRRPFRAPHHSTTLTALLGGGASPTPGEISLAHHGVLFLDEFAEFPRGHIEALRQPLTERSITIGRAKYTCTLPARFQLIAATNPCPCGYYGDIATPCQCYDTTRKKYLSKISGPLLDRIDIHLHIRRQGAKSLIAPSSAPYTEAARERIVSAHEFRALQPYHNVTLSTKQIPLFKFDRSTLEAATALADTHALSGRSLLKLLGIARTIADLELCVAVKKPHLEEAWSFKEP